VNNKNSYFGKECEKEESEAISSAFLKNKLPKQPQENLNQLAVIQCNCLQFGPYDESFLKKLDETKSFTKALSSNNKKQDEISKFYNSCLNQITSELKK